MVQLLEGQWEEILTHSKELEGHRVRVEVLPQDTARNGAARRPNQQMLAVLDRLDADPWTAEELEILDGFEAFQREHPLRITEIADPA